MIIKINESAIDYKNLEYIFSEMDKLNIDFEVNPEYVYLLDKLKEFLEVKNGR